MKKIDWTKENEASGANDRLPAGGYICKITNVEDNPQREYLKIEYEIVDGQYKGWGEKTAGQGWWKLSFIRSYKPKARGFFKHFLAVLEKSNPGKFTVASFGADENVLRGLFLGLVVGYEEYEGYDGAVKERLYVSDIVPGQDIRSGNFKVPEFRKLENPTTTAAEPKFDTPPTPAGHTPDDDLPF